MLDSEMSPTQGSGVRISVVVPVFNTAAHLEGCIQALQRQDFPAGAWEILLVDNNSTDGSAAILARAEGVRTFHQPVQGSYAARNLGVREARGEIVAFTDSDCLPCTGWLRAIESAFEDPEVQVVLGCRRPAREGGLVGLLADYENHKDALVFSGDDPRVYYGFTNNMAVRRTTLEQFGPFVERPRGADTIFVRRVADGAGTHVVRYLPAMRITHAELDGVGTYFKKMFIYGRSRQRYRNLMPTRALSREERLAALRSAVQGRSLSAVRTLVLGGLLAVGVVAWHIGSMMGRMGQEPPR
jgi:glycosyltransferase involved in cell wall biosynthesis